MANYWQEDRENGGDDSLKRLLIKMRNMGVDDALRNAGAQDGDNVAIGEFEFDFYE